MAGPHGQEGEAVAADPDLLAWSEAEAGGTITQSTRLVGGNRRQTWAVTAETEAGPRALILRYASGDGDQGADPYTLRREGRIYLALRDTGVAIPRIVAAHPSRPAILVERVEGQSRYAGSGTEDSRRAVATDMMRKLAKLHALDATSLDLPGFEYHQDMAGQVRVELAIWRGMYEETPKRDPLIDFALRWLDANVPEVAEPPVLVHGDAGPGNFLHRDDRITALVDWELSHLGDPLEDLAWLSMRTVLEPFPDFVQHVHDYAGFSGRTIDRARLLYHRVFVPFRVVIIRHRALCSGLGDADLANSLISKALNRRLLVESLSAAIGAPLQAHAPVAAPPLAVQAEYDAVLDALRHKIAPGLSTPAASSAAKSAARVIRYLAAVHRFGAALDAEALDDLGALVGEADGSRETLEARLSGRIAEGTVDPVAVLAFFARDADRETQLMADAMGALATRHMPPFEKAA